MKAINQNSANVFLGKGHFKDNDVFHPLHFKATGIGNWYKQDLEYFQQPSFQTQGIPNKVQLEYWFKSKILSDFLLTFKNDAGFLRAFTGLRKTIFSDWFYGDLRTITADTICTSLVLVQFSPDKLLFRLYLFDGFYPVCKKRINIISKLIQEINATGKTTKQSNVNVLRRSGTGSNLKNAVTYTLNP